MEHEQEPGRVEDAISPYFWGEPIRTFSKFPEIDFKPHTSDGLRIAEERLTEIRLQRQQSRKNTDTQRINLYTDVYMEAFNGELFRKFIETRDWIIDNPEVAEEEKLQIIEDDFFKFTWGHSRARLKLLDKGRKSKRRFFRKKDDDTLTLFEKHYHEHTLNRWQEITAEDRSLETILKTCTTITKEQLGWENAELLGS